MNVRPKKTLEHIEQVFAQAHRLREEIVVEPDWTHGIMREIRRGDAAQGGLSMLAWAEPLVWRVAAGVALVAVLFAGSVLVYTGQRSHPMTTLWLEELDTVSLFHEE